jgi:deazaflavin-dependent oxidoreductase (nitroreductase family)
LIDNESLSARAPFFVSLFNPIGRRLAGAGLMGPNALLTVRGRKSGISRTTPVAFVEVDGRRWIIATFGDVNWARNLRAAGEATITIKRRPYFVHAIELSPDESARFFREVLAPFVRRLPVGKLILRMLGAKDILTDPDGAARRRPVFELTA